MFVCFFLKKNLFQYFSFTEAFCLKPQKQVEISCDASISNVDDLSVFQGQLSRRRTSSIPSDTD